MVPRRTLGPLAALLAAATLGAAAPEGPVIARAPEAPSMVRGPIVRSEHFLLEEPDGTLAGLAMWRRRESTRGVQLERELVFRAPGEPGVDPGLFHVECLERSGSRLVQRESGSSGRVVLAEMTRPAGALRAYEWGPCGARQELPVDPGTATLPLYLVELARSGRFAAGRVGCFDPQARAVVELEATTIYATDGTPGRTTELRRADGTLVLELRFEGTELHGFRMQDGGPWARRVDVETWERVRGSETTVVPR